MLSTFILGSGIKIFLIEALFKVQKGMSVSYAVPTISDYIHNRKPLKIKICSRCRDKKNRKLQKKAEDLLSDQLDIVEFLQHQMISKVSIRTIFSKIERYLLIN